MVRAIKNEKNVWKHVKKGALWVNKTLKLEECKYDENGNLQAPHIDKNNCVYMIEGAFQMGVYLKEINTTNAWFQGPIDYDAKITMKDFGDCIRSNESTPFQFAACHDTI